MFSYQTMEEVIDVRGLDFSKPHTTEERKKARGDHPAKK